MLGDLFPGRKLLDESGEDADGEKVQPRWGIDLDAGVVRLRGPAAPSERPGDVSDGDADPESDGE